MIDIDDNDKSDTGSVGAEQSGGTHKPDVNAANDPFPEFPERKPSWKWRQHPPWPKAHSGNPKGRPKGSKNKRTLMAEKLAENIDQNAEEILNTVIRMVRAGDQTALRIITDRILPALKTSPRALNIELPELNSIQAATQSIAIVADALANGDITDIAPHSPDDA